MHELDYFFNPRSVAIIGASHKEGKVGSVITKNFLNQLYTGSVYLINVDTTPIYEQKVYPSIQSIPASIDLAVIATPAKTVTEILMDCVKKEVKAVIIISSGFSETGNEGRELEETMRKIVKGSKTSVIGPNCLGVFDAMTFVDTLFLPREKCNRPKRGNIAFISQSGAVGSTILDWLAEENIGISKFISYGNAMDVNETDLIEYLGNDPETKVITAYIEGIKSSGKRFIEVCKKVSEKKPIVILKAGKTKKGTKAVSSHTGSLAGSGRIYSSAFRQARIVEAETWEELFDYAKAFSTQPLPRGNRIVIITDGGGFGVLATDEAERSKLELPEPSEALKKKMLKSMPTYVSLENPVDLTGDTDALRYKVAIEECLESGEFDGIIVISLFQVPNLGEEIVDYIVAAKNRYLKPILGCAAGGEFSNKMASRMTENGVPFYTTPERVVKTMKALVMYSQQS